MEESVTAARWEAAWEVHWEVEVLMTAEVVRVRAVNLAKVRQPRAWNDGSVSTPEDLGQAVLIAAEGETTRSVREASRQSHQYFKAVHQCARPGCEVSSESKCERCRAVVYCCQECQAADWPKHKDTCTRYKLPRLPPIPTTFSPDYFRPRPYDMSTLAEEDPLLYELLHSPAKEVETYMRELRAAIDKEPAFHSALHWLMNKRESGTQYIVGPLVAMTCGPSLQLMRGFGAQMKL